MKKRLDRFKEAVQDLDDSSFKSLLDFSVWLGEWAIYVMKGGTRPPKPH